MLEGEIRIRLHYISFSQINSLVFLHFGGLLSRKFRLLNFAEMRSDVLQIVRQHISLGL